MEKKSYVCYDENDNEILSKVDNHFKNIAVAMGANEYHIPALIGKEVIERCGYFTTFPQHLTPVSHFEKCEQINISNKNSVHNHQICNCGLYLTPAACLHLYPMLENSRIDKKVITTKARVYRYENAEFDGSTRLWDFTVREIVFIGPKEFVVEKLELMKLYTKEFANRLKLDVRISEACDNFYPNKHNLIKMRIQKRNSMKYECITNIEDKEVAICSYNYHGTHFSKEFNFDNGGEIVTGCVGYGLERWVSAIKDGMGK